MNVALVANGRSIGEAAKIVVQTLKLEQMLNRITNVENSTETGGFANAMLAVRANELRVGNLISLDDIPVRVRTIGDTTYSVKTDKMDWKAEMQGKYKPISITDEWLNKFGFDYDAVDYSISLDELGKDLILIKSKDGYFYPTIYATAEFSHLENQTIALNRIKSVHELQNLYFTLTGKELKIKEDEN